jgi:hypothetical protein
VRLKETMETESNLLSFNLCTGVLAAVSSWPWPHRLKSGPLQKGVFLTTPQGDLNGEGLGFGSPIAFYRDKPVFSTHAHLQALEDGAVKTFTLDAESTKRWSNLHLVGLPGPEAIFNNRLTRYFAGIYRSQRMAQIVANGFWRFEQSTSLIDHGFKKAENLGNVVVKYAIKPGVITIMVDPSKLSPCCRKLCIMNELDANVFTVYDDSDGAHLKKGEVGAWSPVDANWAKFSAPDGSMSFRLFRMESAKMYRGREFVPGHLSWSGIAYEQTAPLKPFSYNVEIEVN